MFEHLLPLGNTFLEDSSVLVAEMATLRLSELMRRVLETDTSAIPINEEVAAVTAYPAIERLRFAEKLRVRWQVDPAVAHTNLPRFSLLTLVENAVTHGVSRMMRGGTVTVTARGGNGRLLVAVADDGAGMSREQRASALNVASDRLHGLILLDRQCGCNTAAAPVSGSSASRGGAR